MTQMQIEQILAKANDGQAQAQFLLSQICLQKRDLDGMVQWLRRASEQGLASALDALGHCYEKGQGVPRDAQSALQHYERALAAGSALAAYRKAELLYKSRHGPSKEQEIRELLFHAASQNVMPALRAIGYLALQQPSSWPLAIDCFRRAATSGDVISNFNLAWCLLQKPDGDAGVAEAAYCLRRAAAAHYPYAQAMLSALPQSQASAAPAIASAPLQIDTALPLYPAPQEAEHTTISKDPGIKLFDNVLTVVDCAHLMMLSLPSLRRAHVIDPEGGRDGQVSDIRTSMSTYLPFAVVDFIARYIELKIVGATGEQLETSEPMSILRYAPGEYYRPHVDYFNPKLKTSRELLEDGGQRTASAVTYLAAPAAGGGTRFPNLNLSVPAVTGSTLWFRNCHADGRIDERSLHAGDTVDDGEKWVVTKWFRERPTSYLEN
ncbi:MAG: 2OG-Fe(II) oxygenase [Woeseiaceae bacterium]